MATVSKEIADRIAAGEFKSDGIAQIVEYDNAFGGVSYGTEDRREVNNRYLPSNFVRNPRIYWNLARDGYKGAKK